MSSGIKSNVPMLVFLLETLPKQNCSVCFFLELKITPDVLHADLAAVTHISPKGSFTQTFLADICSGFDQYRNTEKSEISGYGNVVFANCSPN